MDKSLLVNTHVTRSSSTLLLYGLNPNHELTMVDEIHNDANNSKS